MINITISLISLNRWKDNSAAIYTELWLPRYQFNKLRLLAPYLSALLLALPIVTIGLHALQSNGVPASAGFMQIVATTLYSPSLRKSATGASLGGNQNFSEEFRNLKVQYGELQRKKLEDSNEEPNIEGSLLLIARIAGFGTADEIMSLTKGGDY
jgi:hypothetical protein